ncbi:MAG: bacillithiol biosynthesis cysteine-adding enzyme BshC [Cyclobacteriaceae bacterium]
MKTTKISLKETGKFSSMFLEYLEGSESLSSFYRASPAIENFKEIIENHQISGSTRITLSEELQAEYGALECHESVQSNIHALRDAKTFTVTTGHQLNIFTGPLYFIFKIATAINLAKKLKAEYPDYHFVPVYWMASEDHDFEEISYFNLFGKKYTWETEQTGAVGRFAPQSLNTVLEQMPECPELFEKAYLDSSSLAEAARIYVNELFGEHGLVVVDADNPKLKAEFTSIIKDDLQNHHANRLVEATNQKLIDAGYKSQAFSREINFFLLNGYRERIVKESGNYKINNSDESFSEEDILKLVDSNPEKFSPNVIMRPVYQEVILPNLAYIGGPAEIVYWLQLKDVFDHYDVSFPILMPRNFGMIINKGQQKKIDKLGLDSEMLFMDTHDIKSWYISTHSDNEHLLDEEKEHITEVYNRVKQKAGSIDKSLEGFIGSENAKALKAFENIEKRLKKAQESQNETALNQIDAIKDKLFPGGGLQERSDNFLNFYLNNPKFIDQLLAEFDPFEFNFYKFWE